MSRAAVALLVVGPLVFVIGALADFDDPYARTGYALGVATSAIAFLVAGAVLEQGRRRG